MSPYVVNQDSLCKTYDLCAISNHYGGLGGGHYTAYCKNKSTGKWYHFDDSSVTEMDGDSHDRLVSKAAYVLVYLRQDVSKEFMRQSSTYDDEMGEKDDEMSEKDDEMVKKDEDMDEESHDDDHEKGDHEIPKTEDEEGSEPLQMDDVEGSKD
jgi:ubiquitin carboxyl-terminal hydrolase 4/11/15